MCSVMRASYKKMSEKKEKSLAKNVVLNLIKTFSSIIFPLITFPYISRVLLPEYVGKYNFANTYVSYFLLIASLGVTTYAIRECSVVKDDKEKLETVASQIFSINICSMIVAYALLFISLFFFRGLDTYRIAIIILSLSIFFTIIGADWLNSAFEDFKYITIRTVVFQFISLIALFIFVKKPTDYIKYAVITVISVGGANILNVFYRRRYGRVKFLNTLKDMEWKKHFPPIILLFAMILVQTIFSSSDITMLGIMRSDYEVGLYSTATKIYNMMNQIMASILWVMLPRLTGYFEEKNYREINILLKKCTQFMMGLGLPCIVGGIFLSDEIVTIIGGIEYIRASLYLKILMGSLFFSLIGGSLLGNMILLPAKKEKFFLQACVVAAVVNIVLNIFFIPKFGAIAASITTLIAHIILFVMLVPRVDKEINIGTFRENMLAPICGSALVAVIIVILKSIFQSNWMILIVSLIISVVVYLIVLVVMRYQVVIDVVKEKMM
ncbi:Membrane protein involved in the export of O-antigen and teichoic acid [Lachnospiraceae bacterium A10]|nr:Membrane protein involved in the export of O-antigen and teichoic acid [Lachnospiraceae bacterium A10]